MNWAAAALRLGPHTQARVSMGQHDELGGAALPRSAPRRDASSGRGVRPARPQEDPVELAHLRAALARSHWRRGCPSYKPSTSFPRGLRALLAQVTEQDLLDLCGSTWCGAAVRHGRLDGVDFSCWPSSRRLSEDPEGRRDLYYAVSLTEDPDLRTQKVVVYPTIGFLRRREAVSGARAA